MKLQSVTFKYFCNTKETYFLLNLYVATCLFAIPKKPGFLLNLRVQRSILFRQTRFLGSHYQLIT